ncbi:MAG: hypothetical protein ACD_77C00146G0003 [uncultured bacterium]|nr:MAG: hypothetical protein ACD_77C00146G0003 [uncultured bacterium]
MSILYKYTDIVGAKKFLRNLTLKFSKPKEFNDPFEFHEKLIDDNLSEEHFLQILSSAGITDPNTISAHREIFKRDYPDFVNRISDTHRRRKEATKLCCFSTDHDNILMWSHYAEKHKGICIGFSKEIIQSILPEDSTINGANYCKNITPLNISVYKDEAINNWVLTKYQGWEYENEVRIIIGGGMNNIIPASLIKIPENSISEIYLGCIIDPKEKKNIRKLIKKLHNKPDVYEMNISDSEFKLIRNKIDSI